MAGSAQAASSVACSPKAGPLTLTGFSLIYGPPAQEGHMAPERTVDTKTGLTNYWSLPRSKLAYWLRCEYGARAIDLKLPDTIRQCSARYDKAQKVVLDGKQPTCR